MANAAALAQHQRMIEQALAPAAPTLAAAPPGLTTGNPLIPEQNLNAIIAQALRPGGAPVNPRDRSDAMMKLGTALMQPRQPGQSVAGNIGAAMQGSSDLLSQRRKENTALAIQQGQMANQVASADLARKKTNMNMQVMAATFPAEFQLMQQKLRQAMLAGKQDEVAFIKNTLMLENGAELLARTLRAEVGKAEAAVGETEARGKYYDAAASYYSSFRSDPNRQVKLGEETTADGRHVLFYGQGGKVYAVTTTPAMDEPAARSRAKRELEAELAQAQSGMNVFSKWFAPGVQPEALAKRTKKYMTPSRTVEEINVPGVTPKDPTSPASTSPATAPAKGGKARALQDLRAEYQAKAKELAEALASGDKVLAEEARANLADITAELKLHGMTAPATHVAASPGKPAETVVVWRDGKLVPADKAAAQAKQDAERTVSGKIK